MIKHTISRLLNLFLKKEVKLVLKKYKPKTVSIETSGDRATMRRTLDVALSKFFFVRSGEDLYATIFNIKSVDRNIVDEWYMFLEGLALIFLPNHFPEWLVVESGDFKADFVLRDEEGKAKYKDYEIVYDENRLPIGITFVVTLLDFEYKTELQNTIGEEAVEAVLKAFDFIQNQGKNVAHLPKAFSYMEPQIGHRRLVLGPRQSVFIDETFDTTPERMKRGIAVLKSIKDSPRRIAILGDMHIVGNNSTEEHKKVGQEINENIDLLVTVGIRARSIAEGAVSGGFNEANIFQYDDADKAFEFINSQVKQGDVVYINGSKDMEMGNLVR